MFEKVKEIKSSKLISYITYTLVLWFLLYNYTSVLKWVKYLFSLFTPLIIALVIAFILNIPMSSIEELISKKFKLKKSYLRTLSLTVTMLGLIVIVIILSSIIVPRLLGSVYTILINLTNYADALAYNVEALIKSLHLHEYISQSDLNEFISTININKLLPLTQKNGISILFQTFGYLSVIVTGIITFVMSLYLLANKEVHLLQARKFTVWFFGKQTASTIFDLTSEANYYFNGFISGQLIDMVLFAIMIYIPFRLINLPFTELMAILVGFCSLIPMFGCYISFLINLLLVLALAPQKLVAYIVIFIIVQQFEANVLYPRVVGKAVGISGLYVILALSVFGKLFGFLGLLIAVPCMALLYAVFSRLITITLYRRRLEVTENAINDVEGIDEDIPHTYRGH